VSVLDSIDTTVTLEWQGARTIGTLIELGGRTAILTALRTPGKDDSIHIVVEGELPEETVTIDGRCRSVAETAWGEQQAEVELMRVGTTRSASRLRDFIEEYGILRGGSVHIGRNRDNPNRKRFVYHLPEISQSIRTDKKRERQRRATISGMRQTSPQRQMKPTVVPPSGPVQREDPSYAIAAELANMDPAPYASSTPTVTGPPRSSPAIRMAMAGVSGSGDHGFGDDPGDTHPDFDVLADAFVNATTGLGPDLGFDGPNIRTNPDAGPPVVAESASMAVTNELDQALREALEAVDQPRIPGAPTAGAQDTAESALQSLEATPESVDIPDLPAADPMDFGDLQLGDDAFQAGNEDLQPGIDDLQPGDVAGPPGVDSLQLDDSFGADFGDDFPEMSLDPPKDVDPPQNEVGGGVVIDEVEPTRLMQAVSDGHDTVESIKSTIGYGAEEGPDDDGDLDDDPTEDMRQHVSEELIAKIDDAIALERAFSDSEYHDDDEPIIVNTVPHGVPFADPVKLGHDNQAPNIAPAPVTPKRPDKVKKSGKRKRAASGARAAVTTDSLARPKSLGRRAEEPAEPKQEEQIGSLHRRHPSDALVKVQNVFGVDMAIRCDLPVVFGSGRAKRQGQLLRLAESRLRIASDHQPGLYERLAVTIPDPAGGKSKIQLDCEVTRIREPDDEEANIAFDMRLAGSNSPKQMQALRKLIRSFEAPPA